MKVSKWYHNLLTILLLIIFFPIIFVFIVIAGILLLIEMPKNRKMYKQSRYYKDLHIPFSLNAVDKKEYRFYNSAIERGLKIQFTRQDDNCLEYFRYDGTLYLFPDFSQIDFDEEQSDWKAYYDGTWKSFDHAWQQLLLELHCDHSDTPVKVLIERDMIPISNLNLVTIPECIALVQRYENAFSDDDAPLECIYPQNTKELYEMMLRSNDLCGQFELIDEKQIRWYLYDGFVMHLSVDQRDCYIGIERLVLGKIESNITHWHPDHSTIFNDVCQMGKQGSVMVIRTFLTGASVLYQGSKADCPYEPNKKSIFGKLHYLEAN